MPEQFGPRLVSEGKEEEPAARVALHTGNSIGQANVPDVRIRTKGFCNRPSGRAKKGSPLLRLPAPPIPVLYDEKLSGRKQRFLSHLQPFPRNLQRYHDSEMESQTCATGRAFSTL
jgi:hypothetical protein